MRDSDREWLGSKTRCDGAIVCYDICLDEVFLMHPIRRAGIEFLWTGDIVGRKRQSLSYGADGNLTSDERERRAMNFED